jgi:hypothetical protein
MSALTLGEFRALRAVRAGRVIRLYRGNGNVFRAEGVSKRALWQADKNGFIKDGPDCTGEMERRCKQILTPAGLDALMSAETRS